MALVLSILYFSAIGLSRKIHKKIIYNLLKASFPKFYNVIMTGRLMNRLSKDIYVVDITLSALIVSVFQSLFSVCAVLFSFIAINVIENKFYYHIPVLSLQLIMIYLFAMYYLRTMREVSRIESIAKTPILSFISEVIRGCFFVKNCVKKDIIFERHINNVNTDLRN